MCTRARHIAQVQPHLEQRAAGGIAAGGIAARGNQLPAAISY